MVQAIRHILNVDSEVNDLIEDLEDVVDSYYEEDIQNAAYDCYSYDQALTDWLLLESSILDIDESAILIKDSKTFLNEYFYELRELYKIEEADHYEFVQVKAKKGKLQKTMGSYEDYSVEYEFYKSEDEQDEAPYKTAEDDMDYYYAKEVKADKKDEEHISDAENLMQAIVEAIDRIEDGNSDVNELIEEIERFIEETYDDDYELVAGDLYQLNSQTCDIIYAWIAHYDVDEITFLTQANMQVLEDIKIGFDTIYIDLATEPTQLELMATDSIEDFLETLIYGLELCLVGDTECDAILRQCDFYVDGKWDGDRESAAEDSYAVEPELTYDTYALFQIMDLDELLWVDDDQLNFANDFWGELGEVLADEETEDYDMLLQLQKHLTHEEYQNYGVMLQLKKTDPEVLTAFMKILFKTMTYVDNADPKANELVDILDYMIDEFWDGDFDSCAEDCIQQNKNATDRLLLEYSLVDIDECKFLTDFAIDWIQAYENALQDVYKTQADHYDDEYGDYYMLLQEINIGNNILQQIQRKSTSSKQVQSISLLQKKLNTFRNQQKSL